MITIGDCEICGSRCRTGSTLCYTCEQQQRKEERNSMRASVVKPVKKVTEKRAGETREYLKLKREYLQAYPACEIEDCDLKSVDVHHMGTRTNHNLTNTNLFLAVCRKHHELITRDSAWAKANGYSVIRTGNFEKDNH